MIEALEGVQTDKEEYTALIEEVYLTLLRVTCFLSYVVGSNGPLF